jgi:ABC-type antimicrobial peptide transport system permease subunit
MITVIFFVTLMQVRERSREIGTLKAIGASDGGVTVEVLTEAIALTILGGLVALIFFKILGEMISGPVFAIGITPFLPSHYQPLVQSLSVSKQISVSGLGVLVSGAVLASAIGSAYGLWQVFQLSPLEAMKHE